jgi:hypothetical protein
MERIVRISLIVVVLAASIAVIGCSRTVIRAGGSSGTATVKNDKKGPPPHAPAHGYRHKHGDGVVLVFESSLGVYVVSGHKDLYFHKDRYYRLHKSKWQSSGHIEGPWRKSPSNKIPQGLQKNVAETNQGKGKGKNK